MEPFEIFICHKKSSGKDFAEHLKAGLEELGYHSFLDSKDIPKTTDGKEEWVAIRDQALKESSTFILIITPGFDLSEEVKNELELARSLGNKQFIYFRHRDLGRKIIVDLGAEKVDLGRQEQVSFESKEELLRLAHTILLKSSVSQAVNKHKTSRSVGLQSTQTARTVAKTELNCEMCAKPIEGQPYKELICDKTHIFDCKECAQTFKKFRCMYGDNFQG
ncbi:MAG TPA: toll/interleukin-1 receptor domain-containing protein [Candidatus Binatia bacterium]|nr:toll/interleukin-1 receptor domain-containing protein [Candidatus Binatia bacterium]